MRRKINSFSSLRSPAFVPLFAAKVAGSAGDGFGQLALAWGTLQLGHGAKGLSLVLACKALPSVLVLAGGILGDRFRRHRVLAGTDALAAGTWIGLAACFAAGAVPLPVVCALAMLAGTARALHLPAARGIVADVVRRERRQPANALLNQAESAGLCTGLLLSGAVVATAGPGVGALLKAVLAAVSATLLVRLKIAARPGAESGGQPGGGMGPPAGLRAGWREFAANQWVWVLTAQLTVVAVAVGAFAGVIGPLYMAQGHGDAGGWGVVAGCEALGALAGGFLIARWRPGRPLLIAALLPVSAAVPMVLLGGAAPWVVIAGSMLFPGFCQAAYFVLFLTAIQNTFPPQMLSRVNSWVILGNLVLTPVALLVAGPISEAAGARGAAIGAGLLVLGVTALTPLSPQIRRFGARPAGHPAGHPVGPRVGHPAGRPSLVRCRGSLEDAWRSCRSAATSFDLWVRGPERGARPTQGD